jgi:hypothetical protein
MNDKLLKKYLEYAKTDEAFAVLFVKRHLSKSKGHIGGQVCSWLLRVG